MYTWLPTSSDLSCDSDGGAGAGGVGHVGVTDAASYVMGVDRRRRKK